MKLKTNNDEIYVNLNFVDADHYLLTIDTRASDTSYHVNMTKNETMEFLNESVKRTEGPGQISDGYHTFDELYEHRIELFLALCREIYRYHGASASPWMSQLHSDGSSFDGWFVAGIGRESGQQITYHLPMKYWTRAAKSCRILEKAPEYDGHTSADVLERLKKL